MNNVLQKTANGVVINAPLFNPDAHIIVWDKQHPGKKISLPSMKYFDSKFHSKIENEGAAPVAPMPTQRLRKGMPISAPAVPVVEPVTTSTPGETVVVESELDSKERFELLKSQRAWLKPELKEEYSRLKEIHG